MSKKWKMGPYRPDGRELYRPGDKDEDPKVVERVDRILSANEQERRRRFWDGWASRAGRRPDPEPPSLEIVYEGREASHRSFRCPGGANPHPSCTACNPAGLAQREIARAAHHVAVRTPQQCRLVSREAARGQTFPCAFCNPSAPRHPLDAPDVPLSVLPEWQGIDTPAARYVEPPRVPSIFTEGCARRLTPQHLLNMLARFHARPVPTIMRGFLRDLPAVFRLSEPLMGAGGLLRVAVPILEGTTRGRIIYGKQLPPACLEHVCIDLAVELYQLVERAIAREVERARGQGREPDFYILPEQV